MASWNIGKENVSEETQSLKNKLSSKATECAALETRLIKRNEELEDLRTTLNDTLHKLTSETNRALGLERDLSITSTDLQNANVKVHNTESALLSAQEIIRAEQLAARELQVQLESLSHRSDDVAGDKAKLSRQNATLEARVRELESDLRRANAKTPNQPAPSRIARPRSSSVHTTFRPTAVEQELADARATIASKDAELRKLGRVQADAMKATNEKIALEKAMKSRVAELESAIEDKEEELAYLRGGGSAGRVQELEQRVEEDLAKITALEMLLKESPDSKDLKRAAERAEQRALSLAKKIEANEAREVELVRDREQALDQLDYARRQVSDLRTQLRDTEQNVELLREQARNLHAGDESMDETPLHIERLLSAVDRLRSERDTLQRDLSFAEAEHRFATEALEARDHTSSDEVTATTGSSSSQSRELDVVRLQNATAALSIVISRIQSGHATSDGDATAEVCARETLQEELVHVKADLADLNRTLEETEADRDALRLQATNLQTDLSTAQSELIEAEARYTTLQMHQLASMSGSDATRALRSQIADLEARVMRRTEQIGVHQHDVRRLETNLRLAEERINEMGSELETLAAQKEAMVEDCADAREARDDAKRRVEEMEVETENLEGRLEDLELQRTVEAATLVGLVFESTVHARQALARAHAQQGKVHESEQCLASLRAEHAETLDSLSQLHRDSADERRQAMLALSLSQIGSSQWDKTIRSSSYDKTIRSGSSVYQQGLESRLAEAERIFGGQDTETELQRLRTRHAEEMNDLQVRLATQAEELEDVRAQVIEGEQARQLLQEESMQSKDELDKQRTLVSDRAQAIAALERELEEARERNAEECRALRDKLACVTVELEGGATSRTELEAERERLIDELMQLKEDHERHATQAAERIQTCTKQFEHDLADAVSSHAEKAGELQAQLEHTSGERTRLETRLLETEAAHAKEREDRQADIDTLTERCKQLEKSGAEARQELATTKGQLVRARLELESLQAEKEAMQVESTNLAAEIQKSLSLTNYLEKTVNENEKTIASLKESLEKTRADLRKSEQSGKAAEVQVTLQSAQHNQTVANLRREIATLQASAKLQEVVAELQERIEEMEEQLRNKCAEIEDNDDKFIEMLKEKKKLTTKVDSLTRKVTSLQTKLTAAKVSAATAVPAPPPPVQIPTPPTSKVTSVPDRAASSISSGPTITAPRPRNAPSNTTPPTSTIFSFLQQPPAASPIPRGLYNRSVSGPSSLPRPKTPERARPQTPERIRPKTPERRTPQSTGRARTPEKRTPNAENTPLATSSSAIGKKRRMPEEFEDPVPAVQPFTANSVPQPIGSSTPRERVRSFLNTVHTGFTPVRAARPMSSQTSPVRRAMGQGGLFASDVTNTPAAVPAVPVPSAKPAKKGWLGKIRSNNTAPPLNRETLGVLGHAQ